MVSSPSKDTLINLFKKEARNRDLNGLFGICELNSFYHALMPIQQKKLGTILGKDFYDYLNNGSIITIAYAYPVKAIQSIAVETSTNYDKLEWNYYVKWYNKLNKSLNETVETLEKETGGISIPATLDGITSKIKNVEKYYSLVISHRVGAELSGVGWRGKNELIINPKYSCAIRLASTIVPYKLEGTESIKLNCGECQACTNICPFLKYKDKLVNYREQCRRYILSLGLGAEVCGKCIKACVFEGIYAEQFELK
jgi:epoxyqueuosine reductase QueG